MSTGRIHTYRNRGKDTIRALKHAKDHERINRGVYTKGNLRTLSHFVRAFTFHYFQHCIFAQVQLPTDLAVGLPSGYQRQYLRR